MTSDPGAPPTKLSLVVQSGDAEKVHYALVMAAAAVATDTPVTLFFTNSACRALLPGGWRDLPTADGGTGASLDTLHQDRNVGRFEDLIRAAADLGARFLVCEMGLKTAGLDFAILRDDLPLEPAGVVTFLSDANADGATFFI